MRPPGGDYGETFRMTGQHLISQRIQQNIRSYCWTVDELPEHANQTAANAIQSTPDEDLAKATALFSSARPITVESLIQILGNTMTYDMHCHQYGYQDAGGDPQIPMFPWEGYNVEFKIQKDPLLGTSAWVGMPGGALDFYQLSSKLLIGDTTSELTWWYDDKTRLDDGTIRALDSGALVIEHSSVEYCWTLK